jgi:hypothetical protein
MSCSFLEKLKAQEFVLQVVCLHRRKNTRIIVKDHVFVTVVETKKIFHKVRPNGEIPMELHAILDYGKKSYGFKSYEPNEGKFPKELNSLKFL